MVAAQTSVTQTSPVSSGSITMTEVVQSTLRDYPLIHVTQEELNASVANIRLARTASVLDGVHRAAIGRRALLHGESVGREMGISTWIAFVGTDDHALAQGEFAPTFDELQNLLKALRSKNFMVTSIRNHTAGEHPQFLFVRFCSKVSPLNLQGGLCHALDVQVGAIATEDSAGHNE